MMDTQVREAVGNMESSLGSKGRVLIRPSGTEPLIRIMVEANNLELANNSQWPNWYDGNEFKAIRDKSRQFE